MAIIDVHVTVDCGCDHRRKDSPLDWNVGPVSEQRFNRTSRSADMLQITDTQKVRVQVAGLDKKGQPATVPTVSFSSSDANVASVVPDPADPSAAEVLAGVPGACQIKASATFADGSTAEGALDITVVGGAAVSLSLTAGAVSEQ